MAGRETALKILVWVDQVPRYCLVLMLPVGYTLALRLGVVRLPPTFLALLWVIGFAWLWMVWAIHHCQGTPFGERLRRVDLGWRFVLAAGLLFDAWQGFHRTGHLLTDWVSLKFLIFALLVCCGIMIRIRGKPSAPALRQIFTTGSTPELEADGHAHRRTHAALRAGDLGAAGGGRLRRHFQARIRTGAMTILQSDALDHPVITLVRISRDRATPVAGGGA